MGDRVTSDFLNCKVDANLTKEEQRKVVQSVELTKALVLMGYQTWSALEPGKMGTMGCNLFWSWYFIMK